MGPSAADFLRYQCQLHLPEWNDGIQKKLQNAHVLCVGAGGLAHGALPYLAAAGVGAIGIMDGDQVELSNLHRQVLFTPEDIGKGKAECVSRVLRKQNPEVQIKIYPEYLSVDHAFSILEQYDVVLDCSDNFFTRYLVNDVCYFLNKPNVSAAVVGFEGYLFVSCKDKSPCYRCLYREPPAQEASKNCNDFGVLGTLPGLFGLMQATEAIKLLTAVGEPLYGKLLSYRALENQFSVFEMHRKSDCILCGHASSFDTLPRYEEYGPVNIIEITPEVLRKNMDDYLIVDVREVEEREQFSLPSISMPMSLFQERFHELDRHRKIITYCAHGIRSKRAAVLLKKAGYPDVSTLKGGVAHWRL